MKPEKDYLIGVDLGGSSVKAAALTLEGEIILKRTLPFTSEEEQEWAQMIPRVIHEFEQEINTPACSVGLSAPGLASNDERSIQVMPGRLHGLVGLDWTDHLRRANTVRVLNDAQAALLGEAWLGAARHHRHVVMLTLGTGVGGAILLDGEIFRGKLGRAGHVGHMTVNHHGAPDITGMPGSLEDAIGNCTIGSRSLNRFSDTHDLIAAYRAGDPNAVSIWLESVRALASGIASIVNLIDPELIVIGGGIAAGGDALFAPLHGYLRDFEWRVNGAAVRIVPAELGEYAGACGAAIHAWRRN